MTNQNDSNPHKWELWAKGKKPSMKRRSNSHDYTSRGIYMITMATEGRRPILGKIAELPHSTDENPIAEVVLTPFGEKVKDCWFNIPQYHPMVKPLKLCIMPDHIHGLLFVKQDIGYHLGRIIWGFKVGTNQAARLLGLLPVLYTAELPQYTGQRHPKGEQRNHGVLWETGYNDRILQGKDQLERMNKYIDDNPRRWLIKHKHPEYFNIIASINVAGIPMQAMGNYFLLDCPSKIQVQCSRHLYQNDIEQLKEIILMKGRKGSVIVSPCISAGEQQIATAALSAGFPLIVLLLKGFHPYFKPQPRYLEACSKGRLLMLSPFPWQNEIIENMRQRCLQLNAIAAQICNLY